MSCKLEPAIWSHDTGQWIPCFDRCQLIIKICPISKKYTVTQVCMSLSTYYLEYGSYLARLHRCRRHRRCAYAPTSNTASHDNYEKINSWVSFCFPYEYGAPLGGPLGRRSSAITTAWVHAARRLVVKLVSFVFPGDLTFPSISSRETSGLSGKQN